MKTLSLVVCAGLYSAVVFAAEPRSEASAEIGHLFAHLAASGCTFYRNGSWYPAPDAVAHLERKYEYLAKRGLAPTAESFIERGASESSMSGKPYLVKCGERAPVESAAWLTEELARYRERRIERLTR